LGLLLSQNFGHSYRSQIKYSWNMWKEYLITSKDFSKGVLHAPIRNDLTCTLRGFVVRNQILNLILGPSFDHNSFISNLNEQCKGILSIYTLKPFQWYLGRAYLVFFYLFNQGSKYLTLAQIQLSKWECIWESLGSISCVLPHLWECISLPNTFFWPHVPLHPTLNCKPNVGVMT